MTYMEYLSAWASWNDVWRDGFVERAAIHFDKDGWRAAFGFMLEMHMGGE